MMFSTFSTSSVSSFLALRAIRFYQKFVSPYKGFRCAYGATFNTFGETSCSGYGYKVIARFGLVKGVALLRRRFYDCSWCYKEGKAPTAVASSPTKNPLGQSTRFSLFDLNNPHFKKGGTYLAHTNSFRRQRGSVDCDCGGCDTSGCEPGNTCHFDTCDNLGEKCSFSTPDFTFCGILDCPSFDCGPGPDKKDEKFADKRKRRNEGRYARLKKHGKNKNEDSALEHQP